MNTASRVQTYLSPNLQACFDGKATWRFRDWAVSVSAGDNGWARLSFRHVNQWGAHSGPLAESPPIEMPEGTRRFYPDVNILPETAAAAITCLYLHPVRREAPPHWPSQMYGDA